MPYVTDDDSKAVRRIAEIERELQEAKADLERWLAARTCSGPPTTAAELMAEGTGGKVLTDRLQALATALELQRALASPALHEQERTLAKASPKKMKDFGYRPVTVQFLGGLEWNCWPATGAAAKLRRDKGKGSYFGLTLLGVCDRTTPALGQRSGSACRGAEFLRGRPSAAAADGSRDVDPADCQRGVPFRPAGAAPPGSGRHGHRGLAGREAGRDFHGWGKAAGPRTSGARRPRRGDRVITPIGVSRSCW